MKRKIFEAYAKPETYSNVKFSSQAQNDKINDALLKDLNTAAKNAGIEVTVTTAITGHRQKTTSGFTSRHLNGDAVDVAILNGIGSGKATNGTNGNEQFRELGNKLKDELVSLGYKWNTESGNPKAVLWQTSTGGNHYSHLHVSNKTSEYQEVPLDEPQDEQGGDSKPLATDDSKSDAWEFLSTFAEPVISQIIPDTGAKFLNKALGEEINRIKQLLK